MYNPHYRRAVLRINLQEEVKLLSDSAESIIPVVQLGNGGTFVDRTLPSQLELQASAEEIENVESGVTARLS